MLKSNSLWSTFPLLEANLPISIECIVQAVDHSFLGRGQSQGTLRCHLAKNHECRSVWIEMQGNCRPAIRSSAIKR